LSIFLNIALIVLSIAAVTSVLLQAHGGGLGSIFGGEGFSAGQYKTRRGLEKTLFQVTIGLYVAFFILVLANVFLAGQ
jgi:preprotein translocase subunit SecG